MAPVKTVTIDKSPEELYRFWHNFEDLPCFMHHLQSVTTRGDKLSHWVAKAPAALTVAWDVEGHTMRRGRRSAPVRQSGTKRCRMTLLNTLAAVFGLTILLLVRYKVKEQ